MSSFGATSSRSRFRALLVPVIALGFLAVAAYAILSPPRVTNGYLDFNAFYCGARILVSGSDPYRYEPLHSCEIANLSPATPNAVVPAPLPPYALAAFVPISRLAYPRAQFIWWMMLVVAGVLVLWALVETTGLPLLLVGTIVLGSILLPSLIVGSLALLPIALLCLSAVALKRERWTAAALLQGFACIEPHVAAPVVLATLIFVPAMRMRVLCIGAAIVAVTLIAGHLQLNAEYLSKVLPAHAGSEIGNAEQYGVSAVLYGLGVPERTATSIADLQYALFAIAGLWIVGRLHKNMPESVVFVPMALAVAGGPFVHLTQLGAALPLALTVAARNRTVTAWAGVALVAVAITWQASIGFGAAVAGLVLLAILVANRVPWAGALAAAAALAAVLVRLEFGELLRHQTITLAAIAPNALAEVPWRQLADQFPPTLFSWYGHALVYVGLGCVYLSLAPIRRSDATA